MIAIGAEPVRLHSTVRKIKAMCSVTELGEPSIYRPPSRKRKVKAFGKTQYLTEHCTQYGIKSNTVRSRMRVGIDLETALTMPLRCS